MIGAAEKMLAPIILSISKLYPGPDNQYRIADTLNGRNGESRHRHLAFQVGIESDPAGAEAAIGVSCCGIVFNASSKPLPENVPAAASGYAATAAGAREQCSLKSNAVFKGSSVRAAELLQQYRVRKLL